MTPVGILIALLAIVVSMTMEHGNVGSLIKVSPLLLVVGGSLGATMAGFELRRLRAVPRAVTDRAQVPQGAGHTRHDRFAAGDGEGGPVESPDARGARDR